MSLHSYPTNSHHKFKQQLDHAKIFTAVSRGSFAWGSYEMATRWRGCLVGQTSVSGQKGHNFWSDRWMALKFLLGIQ